MRLKKFHIKFLIILFIAPLILIKLNCSKKSNVSLYLINQSDIINYVLMYSFNCLASIGVATNKFLFISRIFYVLQTQLHIEFDLKMRLIYNQHSLLINKITNKVMGMRKVTIKDVAKAANVSISTVSAALNPASKKISEAKRAEVLKIIDEIGYVKNMSAASLASKGSKRVGFFLKHAPNFENSLSAKLVYYINSEATRNNIELINLFGNMSEAYDEYLFEKIRMHNLTDVIIFGLPSDEQVLQKIKKLDVNEIFIDIPTAGYNSCFIAVDNYEAQKALTKKIIDQNKRNILYITGDMNAFVAVERAHAFESAANEAGVQYEVVEGDFLQNSTYELVRQMDLSEFDAIMCGSDTAAIGVVQYLKEISDYTKVIGGFDGLSIIEHLNYPIFTVDQRIDLFSEAAVGMIVTGEFNSKLIDYTIKEFGTKRRTP